MSPIVVTQILSCHFGRELASEASVFGLARKLKEEQELWEMGVCSPARY